MSGSSIISRLRRAEESGSFSLRPVCLIKQWERLAITAVIVLLVYGSLMQQDNPPSEEEYRKHVRSPSELGRVFYPMFSCRGTGVSQRLRHCSAEDGDCNDRFTRIFDVVY